MPRIRTRVYPGATGTAEWAGPGATGPITSSQDVVYESICTDEFGVHDGAFTVMHTDVVNAAINGQFYNAGNQRLYDFDNFVPSTLRSASLNRVGSVADSSRPSNPELAVKVVKATNPSKPIVDIPVALAELRELPQLIKGAGDKFVKKLASANIKHEFGIKPLVSDLLSLIKCQEDIQKRVEVFSRLQEKPLLRKAKLWSGQAQGATGTIRTFHSAPTSYQLRYRLDRKISTRTVWGYTTWTPTADFQKFPLDDAQIRSLARKAVLGLTVDLTTAWNLIPWSWLFDWFTDFGDFLEGNRQVIEMSHSLPSICETAVHEELWVHYSGCNIPQGGHSFVLRTVTKSRAKASASFPSASLPLLTGRQAGILSSLAALRWR